MSAPEFTPGPWLIHTKHRWVVPAGDAFAEPADALPICQLRDPDERLTEDTALANGFLIAAAPEIHQALLNTLSVAKLKWGNLDEDVNVIFKQADAALAKARGEAA